MDFTSMLCTFVMLSANSNRPILWGGHESFIFSEDRILRHHAKNVTSHKNLVGFSCKCPD